MSGIRSLHRGAVAKGFATASSAPIRVDSTTNALMVNGLGSGSVESPLYGDGVETLVAARTLTLADNNKTFFLALAGGFTVTLPLVSAGFRATFIVAVAPTTAYIIAANAADVDKMAGSVFEQSGGVGDTEAAATADQMNFVANVALIGDNADVISDGTSWFGRMFGAAAGFGTFTG